MADIGTGATIAFSASSTTYDLTSIEISDVSREAIDTTNLGTTVARTFIPTDLYDPGSIDIEFDYDDDNVLTNTPQFSDAAETITITWPTVGTVAVGGIFAASGVMPNFGGMGASAMSSMCRTQSDAITSAGVWLRWSIWPRSPHLDRRIR